MRGRRIHVWLKQYGGGWGQARTSQVVIYQWRIIKLWASPRTIIISTGHSHGHGIPRPWQLHRSALLFQNSWELSWLWGNCNRNRNWPLALCNVNIIATYRNLLEMFFCKILIWINTSYDNDIAQYKRQLTSQPFYLAWPMLGIRCVLP